MEFCEKRYLEALKNPCLRSSKVGYFTIRSMFMKLKLKENSRLESVTLNSLLSVASAMDKIIKESYIAIARNGKRNTKGLKIYAKNFKNGSIESADFCSTKKIICEQRN